ncbi:MAG: type II secretion system GspH family protein [Candidatus Gastranaerophilales bacterium]|nr:type II secretion system GspH family protein [Candidatus Gastranaerophilales bacterium]
MFEKFLKICRKKTYKKGFTLAEVMITFTVIAILAAILIPTLLNSIPDRREIKAKKAYHTLAKALEYLTNDGVYKDTGSLNALYYIDTTVTNYATARNRYFCNNLAEVLNTKTSDCTYNVLNTKITSTSGCTFSSSDNSGMSKKGLCLQLSGSNPNYSTLQANFDTQCDNAFSTYASSDYVNLVTTDGIYWLIQLTDFSNSTSITVNSINIPAFYNLICIDTAKKNDEDSVYGIGVRWDGKILPGAKLESLLEDRDDDN